MRQHAGGVLHFPAGTFKLAKRLAVTTRKPLVVRGLGSDVSRLLWIDTASQGIAITPSGQVSTFCNDGQVTLTGALVAVSYLLVVMVACSAPKLNRW